MIAIDTSALIAMALKETAAARCVAALKIERRLVMSAGTIAETLIFAGQRGFREKVGRLIADLGVEIANVTPGFARRMAQTYAIWGKGVHPAGLNFGDLFAYVVAKDHDCPLLYVGNDFLRTDIASAL